MIRRRWLIPVVGLALLLSGSGAVAAFAPADAGDTTHPQVGLPDPAGLHGGPPPAEPPGSLPPIRSDEGIDPDECNLVHNINACHGQPPPVDAIAVWKLHPDTRPSDCHSVPPTTEPAGPKPPAADFPTTEAPAPIESLDVLVLESYPPQYILAVTSGLPNGCARFGGYEVTRDGDTILVAVTNLVPADEGTICTDVCGVARHNISLGSDFQSGTTYTILVNGLPKTFVAQ